VSDERAISTDLGHSASAGGGRVTSPGVTAGKPRVLNGIHNLDDFGSAARRRLPRGLFSYIAGAAESYTALDRNAASFRSIGMIPRIFGGHISRDQTTQVFGRTYARPFGIAPMGLSALAAYDGDVALAQAADAAGIPMAMSATSLTPMERVAREGPCHWYQAYLPGEDAKIVPMVDRIAEAGFDVLMVTGDVPVASNREDSKRDRFVAPIKPGFDVAMQLASRPRWLLGTFGRTLLTHGMPHFENADVERGPPILARSVARSFAGRAAFSWRHAELVRARFHGKLVFKGIMSHADAARAREIGADGIVVSNHGGRQLDSAVSPAEVLPDIKAVAGDMAVMVDSGIRRGSSVLKAFALGADFVFVGRPFLFAASIAGAAGVQHAVDLLSAEIDRDMAMLGLGAIGDVSAQILAEPHHHGAPI
jgi:L-lactate dehydrogenase (cytochrome)